MSAAACYLWKDAAESMSLKNFLSGLRKRISDRRAAIAPRSAGKLRIIKLEDRKLLDAGFSVIGSVLTLDGFDGGDTLTMEGGQDNGSASFSLQNNIWHVADLAAPFTLSGDSKTLTLTDMTGVNGFKVDAAAAPLANVNSGGTGVQISSLEISGGGNVTLNGAASDFDTVSVDADSLTLFDIDSVEFNNLSITLDASIESDAGDITDAGGTIIGVGGTATFDAINITLGDDAGDTTHFGSLTVISSVDATITEDSDTEFSGSSSIGGDLTLASSGDITDDADADLSVTGNASLTADNVVNDAAITLGDQSNNDLNFGSLTVKSDTDILITEDGATEFSGSSVVGGELTLTSSGSITDAVGATLNITGATLFVTHNNAGSAILLDSTTSEFGDLTARTLDDSGAALVASAISIAENAAMSAVLIETGAGFTGSVALSTTWGDLTIGAGGVSAIGGTVTLSASVGAIHNGAAAGATVTAATVALTAGTGMGATNAISTSADNVTFANASGNVRITEANAATFSGTNAGTGTTTLVTTAGDLMVGAADISTNGGAVTLNVQQAGAGVISAAGSNVSTNNTVAAGADVTIIADNLQLGGNLNAGTSGTVMLLTQTAGDAIDLGATVDTTANTLELSDAELDRVTAGTLNIGDINAGGITFSADITRPTDTNVVLITGIDKEISFGIFSLNAGSGGDVTITTSGTGAITTADNIGTDVTADVVSLSSGSGGIATTSNSLRLAAAAVVANASDANINLFETDTIAIAAGGIDAGTGTINLTGGTFVLGGSNRISDSSKMNVAGGATLDLDTHSDTITQLILTNGTVDGSGSATLTGTSLFDVRHGAVSAILAGNAGLTKTSTDTVTLSGNNSYTGATAINGGRLLVDGSTAAASNVTVNSGAILGGTGTIGGDVAVAADGNITGGDVGTVGTLTVGSLSLDNSTYLADIIGDVSDTIVSAGTIDLKASMPGILNVNATGTTTAGTTFTLIRNTASTTALSNPMLSDGTAAIVDAGATTINGVAAQYSYFGGPGGNDLTVSTSGVLAITGTANADNMTLQQVDIGGVDYLQVLIGASIANQRVLSTVTDVSIIGGDGNDTLTVDYSTGGIFERNIAFTGGDPTSGSGDSLIINGGTFTSATYNMTGTGAGNIEFVGVSGSPTISFTGLEPVTVTSSLTSVIINVDSLHVGTGTNTVEVLNSGTAGMTTVTASATGAAFESITFSNPTDLLEINGEDNGGVDDADQITVTSLGSGFSSGLSIDGQGGIDTVNLNAASLSVATLSLTAETMAQTQAVAVSGITTLNDQGSGNTIDLSNAGNNFGTVQTTASGEVTLRDSDGIVLGASTIGGPLNVTATSGNITDTGEVNVTGDASFTTSQSDADIDLGSLAVTGTIALTTNGTTGDASIVNTVGIDFNETSVSGALSATASTGNITQSGAITGGAAATFIADGDDIILNAGSNDFNSVALTADTASVTDSDSIDIAAATISSTLAVTALNAGNITQSGAISVTGAATFTAADDDVTLGGAVLTTGFGSLNLVAANATIQEDSSSNLSGATIANDLSLTAAGDITDSGDISVTNLAAFDAGSGNITLGDAGENTDFGSLTFNTTGTVSITADSSTQLAGINTALSLDLDSAGAITDASTSLNVTNLADFNGTAISIGGSGTATNFGTLTANSPGVVNISEDSNTQLVVVTGSSVTLTSTGSINDAAADGITDITAITVDLNAATGIGNTASLELAADNIEIATTSGNINVNNTLAAAVDVTRLTTGNGSVTFDQSGGGDVTFSGPVSSGNPASGGAIILTAANGLTVNSTVSSATGSGGTLAIGGATINNTVTVGVGSVSIQGGEVDLTIAAVLSSSSTITLNAERDVTISAEVSTGTGSKIIVTADTNSGTDPGSGPTGGHGGVHITAAGQLRATGGPFDLGGGVTVRGSDVFATAGTIDSVLIDADGTNAQVLSNGAIIIGDGGNAPSGAATIIKGVVQNTLTLSTVEISAEGNVEFGSFGDVLAVDGTVTITADTEAGNHGGQVIMADGAQVATNTASITVTADGNISIGQLKAANNVYVTSTSGAIIDAGDAHVDIIAVNTALSALTGIGDDANALETETSTAAFTNTLAASTDSGDIHIANIGSLTVGTVNGLDGVTIRDASDIGSDTQDSALDNITLSAASPFTVNSAITNNDGGGISLTSVDDGGSDDHLIINAALTIVGGDAIQDATGNIDLHAGTDLVINAAVGTNAAGKVTATSAHHILLQTGTVSTINGDQQLTATAGQINMTNGTAVQSTTGEITAIARTSIAVSSVTTAGNVNLTATSGSISDNGNAAIDISGATATLNAATGIGSGNALETTITTLNATNTTSGTIQITETDSLAIDVVNNGLRDVTISAGGAITDANGIDVNVIAGIFTVDAAGGIDLDTTITSLDASTLAAGDIDINETNAITLTDVDTASGSITVIAGGTIRATDVNSSATDNDLNDIALTASIGDILVDLINAGSSNDVSLDAAGAISEFGSDSPVDIVAGDAEMNAATGIGNGDALETTITNLAFSNSASGDVQITNSQGLMIAAVGLLTASANLTGNVDLCLTTGDLAINTAVSATGNTIRLQTNSGKVIQAATGVISADNLGVRATGDIQLAAATARNNIDSVFAAASTTSGVIEFADNGGFTVGTFTAGSCFVATAGVATTEGSVELTSDNGTLTNTNNITAGGSHNVTLTTTTSGDVILTGTTTAVGNTVTINSVESINGTGLVTASIVDLDAVTGIGTTPPDAINLAATSISAVSISGDIDLNNAQISATAVSSLTTGTGSIMFDQSGGGAVAFNTVTTLEGTIDLLNTGNDLTVISTVTAGGSGNLDLTTLTSGNVILTGFVTAAANTITIDSADQIIGDSPDSAADLMAATASLTAVNGIGTGSGGAIETTISNLSFSNSTSGDVNVSNSLALTLASASNTPGNIELCLAAGDLVISDTLTAGTNIIRLQADAGSVVETISGTITASQLGVRAFNSVILATATNNVDTFAAAAVTGSILFNEADGFVVGTVTDGDCFAEVIGATTPGSGTITLHALMGPLTVGNVVTSNSGNIDIDADNGTVDINAVISSTSGSIDITGDDVTQDASITTTNAGTINVTADSGSISMTSGTSAAAASGAITYDATANVAVSILNSTSGHITVTATGGAITDVLVGEAANLITTGLASLTADTGIGSPDDIDTTIGSLQASTTTSGHVNIQETDGLLITNSGIQTADNGSISVDVDAGNLTVSAAIAANGSGSVTLNADSGILETNAAITTGIGVIDLTADSVDQHANMTTGGTGTINVTADNGGISMDDGTTSSSNTGAITYSATTNVSLSELNSAAGPVNVTATAGNITDNRAGEGAGSENILGTTATLTAGGNIGGPNNIDTAVDTLDASSTTAGSIDIAETDAINLADIDTANGPITVIAGGQITATDVVSTADSDANDISLTSTGGGIEVVSIIAGTGGAADVILDAQNGDISNSGANPDVIADDVNATASGSVTLDTAVNSVTAASTTSGNITLMETDAVTLTSVTTADGAIVVTAGAGIVATSVSANGGIGDSVLLTASTGDIMATNVTAADSVTLDAVAGSMIATSVTAETGNVDIDAQSDVTATDVTATVGNINITADTGDVLVDTISATGTNPTVTIEATVGRVLDSNDDAAVNISASSGSVIIIAGTDIGEAGTDVLKNVASDPLEIDSAVMNLTATGIIAVHQTTSTAVNTLNAGTGAIFLSSDADIDLSASAPTATNLALLTPTGTVTLPATIGGVPGDLRIEANDIAAVGGTIDLNATRILFKSGMSEEISITADEFDGQTTNAANGDLTVNVDSNTTLTDLDCDEFALDVNSNAAVINATAAIIDQADQTAQPMFDSKIRSGNLVLNGTGTYQLANPLNDTDILAGDNSGTITYGDIDDVTIDSVITPANGTITGLSSDDNNILLNIGTTLTINQQLNAGTGDERIQAHGTISQNSTGSITADKLGIHQLAATGEVRLAAANDVNILAISNAANGAAITFSDVDDLTIGAIAATTVRNATFAAISGIVSNAGDILLDAGDTLSLTQQVHAGTADARLIADDNITQTASGIITANKLGVRQEGLSGNIILDDANSIQHVAINNHAVAGTFVLNNVNNLIIGTVSGQNIGNVSFASTDGIATTDADILLNVDGSVGINQQLKAGTSDIRLLSNGTVTQNSAGIITAKELGIRQQAAAGDVSLGAAFNDVDIIAVSNVAVGGNIIFFDADNLTVDEISTQAIGNLTFATASGINANAGDINVTSEGDLLVNRDINAAHNTTTESTKESITLISRGGDFSLADNMVISSDENPAPGIFDDITGDQVTIIAGSSGTNGTVSLGDNTEVRTDGGVARQIAPRPTAFAFAPTTGVENAFVTLTDAANMRSSLTFVNGGFLGTIELVFGVAGEENLQVFVDWGVVSQTSLTASGPAGNATEVTGVTDTYEFGISDANKTIFYIDEGGANYLLPHIYAVTDLATTANDRNGRQDNSGIIGVRFSVAQHASINIWGNAATDAGTGTVETPPGFTSSAPVAPITDAMGSAIVLQNAGLALLSSTDANPLNEFNQQAAQLPLGNITATPTGRPEGQAEWEFVAGPAPGMAPFVATPRPAHDLPFVEAPLHLPTISSIASDINFGSAAAGDAAIGTEVYLQIRRHFDLDSEAKLVIDRIEVLGDSFISSRKAFEDYILDTPKLQDGSGYEVWLITVTSGQQVERPIVKFEITGGRPGPATEQLPEVFEPYELKDLEFKQPDENGNEVPVEPSDTSAIYPIEDAGIITSSSNADSQTLPLMPTQKDSSAAESPTAPTRLTDGDPEMDDTNNDSLSGLENQGDSGDHNLRSEIGVGVAAALFAPIIGLTTSARWKRRQQQSEHSLTPSARIIRRMQRGTQANSEHSDI